MVRLQKFLSEAGVASRRASEGLIRAGRVAIDGDVVREVGVKVDELRQQVSVDGEPVRVRRKRYFAVNKPSGYICTRSDPEGRETLFDLLPKEWVNLYPVGRLDAYSEGLILVTNDGDFCLRVTHPRFGIRKLYVATVRGKVERRSLRRMENGLMHRGEKLKAEKARLLSANNSRSVVELELAEGKNREVRRLFEAQDLHVERLERVRIGSVRLGELPPGKWRTLTESEINSLIG
ncbi:MAG: 23S rRNA pseudouridine2605 synthase [Candidatus Binatia bacterium]|jgi:23S rRNA pseudouridine2605 synthase